MRVGLIACSARKLDHAAPAKDLYTGDLFRLSRDWIAGCVQEWAILSAKHGLVLPDQVLEPYDLALTSMSAAERRAWCDRVHDQLMARWGDQVIYRVVAGAAYCDALSRMPMVEDQIAAWTQLRRDLGMRRPAMGIGVIKKQLKEDLAREAESGGRRWRLGADGAEQRHRVVPPHLQSMGGLPPLTVEAFGRDWAVVRDAQDRAFLVDPTDLLDLEEHPDLRQLKDALEEMFTERHDAAVQELTKLWDQKVAQLMEHTQSCQHCKDLRSLDGHVAAEIVDDPVDSM